MSRPLVIYHANCTDGWCAAWIMDRSLGGVELLAANYGDPPPNVDGRTVFIVDFSYPRAVMEQMNFYAHKMLVLDHHITAEADCQGLPFCIFDPTESGATLAYKWSRDRGFLLGIEPRGIQQGMNSLSKYVKDRDLWQFKQDNSLEINASIRSYPFELKTWDSLALRVYITPQSLTNEGGAIIRYRNVLIREAVARAQVFRIGDLVGMASECTSNEIISDVAGELAKSHDFGACWFYVKGNIKVSLRSKGDIDVSEVAKKFGGGGHKNAAGFTVRGQTFIGVTVDEAHVVGLWGDL